MAQKLGVMVRTNAGPGVLHQLTGVIAQQEGDITSAESSAKGPPEAADLIVTDPVQAGVMSVMAIADTASFTLGRLSRRVF